MLQVPLLEPLLVPLLLGGLIVLALALVRVVGRPWLERTILETDTPSGKAFDALLMLAIALSVLAVVLESDPLLRQRWAAAFLGLEWGFTLLFSLEYLLRLLLVAEPRRYATSFFGLVDLLAILPTYLGLLIGGGQLFLVVRVLRLLRVFRVLKLGAYLQEAELIWSALIAARRKISVFLLAMVTLVILIGAFMYVIEAGNDGFGSIPVAIYWACVTITTAGDAAGALHGLGGDADRLQHHRRAHRHPQRRDRPVGAAAAAGGAGQPGGVWGLLQERTRPGCAPLQVLRCRTLREGVSMLPRWRQVIVMV